MQEVKPAAADPFQDSTWLDRVLYQISPYRGGRRMAYRRMFHAASRRASQLEDLRRERDIRNYADPSKNSRLHDGRWLSSKLSIDSALEEDLKTKRERSRELCVSDSIGGAVDSRVNHVIGQGLWPQARIAASEHISAERAKALNILLEAKFRLWAERCDRTRLWPLWLQQRLFERCVDVDGEAFIMLSDVGDREAEIPLVIEVIDSDRIDTPPEQSGNPLVRLGVEKDQAGRVVAYWVRRYHPGDTFLIDLRFDRVPADRMIHVFEPLFAGQRRGLPWMHRVLNRLRDAKDFDESAVIAAQTQSSYAAFITTQDPYGEMNASSSGTNAKGQTLTDVEPGMVKYLGQNEDVKFLQPSQPSGNHESFLKWSYRRIAAGLNFVYEFLCKDWTGVSFAGGRLVLCDARTDVQSRQQLIKDLAMRRIYCRWLEECVILGVVPISASEFQEFRAEFLAHRWTNPPWRYAINPVQEKQAQIDAIQNNLTTLEDELEEDNRDLDDVLTRRGAEVERQRELNILPAGAAPAASSGSDPNLQTQQAEAADAQGVLA